MWCEDRYYYKYVCASFRDHLSYPDSDNQSMKVIVLIVIMTMYGCGFKPSVSCNVNDIETVITDCKEQPSLGVSKEF